MQDIKLTKKRIGYVINEWYNTYLDEDAYITSLGDKEFLTFCTSYHVVLIGNGIAMFNDIETQVMEYPKIRPATEEDIEKYLGKMDVFKNQAGGISLQFHVKSDKLDFYMTFVLEAEIAPKGSIGYSEETGSLDIIGFESDVIIKTQKEIDKEEDEERNQRIRDEMAEMDNDVSKEADFVNRDAAKGASIAIKNITSNTNDDSKETAAKKRMNENLSNAYFKAMQDAIKEEVSLCLTIEQIKALNDILPFVNVDDAVRMVKMLKEMQFLVKTKTKKTYSFEQLLKIGTTHRFYSKEEIVDYFVNMKN